MAIKTASKLNTRCLLIRDQGFTLIEVAIVLVIMGLILGGLLTPLGAKMENERRVSTANSLIDIKKAIFGFAVINKRLPCPDTSGDGLEASSCLNAEGEIPWATLGISRYDAWGKPYRYRVDNAYSVSISDPPDTTSNLQVRNNAGNALTAVNPNAPAAIIFSCGSNGRPDGENDANNTVNVDANCTNPGTPNGIYNQDISVKDQFDDQLIWISRNTLLNQLISSGKWP